ncbi:hypothetical protein BJ742DRAFT_703861 [Cladochytrium replicatum]|nr:hypothetical protein BJ742DRAFT_703861 [Cladochytrium replicatum]
MEIDREAGTTNRSDENLISPYAEEKQPWYIRRKRWLICGVVTLVFLAIFLPVLFLVIIPKIIQGIVDASVINFNSAGLSNVTATSFTLTGNGTIGNTGSIPADISSEGPISLYWQGKLLGSLPGLPDISAGHGGDTPLVISNTVTVSNEDNFANFAAYLLNNKNFTWVLTSTVTVKALGIPFRGISLNKTVTLNAADKFSNVAIQSFDIPGDSADGKGIALKVATSITNPSDIDFDLGDVTFTLTYSDQAVGTLVGNAVKLKKGENVLSLSGSLQATTPEGLSAVGKLFSNYIKGQASLTKVIGKSASNNNVNIPWLSSSLTALELLVVLPGKAFNIITAISLGNVDVDISPETAYSPTLSAPTIRANYQLPFPFTATPLQAGQNLQLIGGGGPIGTLSTPLAPVSGTEPNVIILSISAPLVSSDNTNFEAFFSAVTNTDSVSFNLNGTVDTVVRTATGDIQLTGIPVNVATSLAGLNGLKSAPVGISNVVVAGGDPNGITINTDTSLNNPSTSKITLNSDAVFDLYYQDSNIGKVTLPSLVLDRGDNNLGAVVYYSPASGAEAAGKAFLTAYVMNQDITVDIRGNADTTTSVESLKSAFSQISLSAGIPILGKQVVTGAALFIPDNIGSTSIAKSTVTVSNPFAAQLTISTIDSTIKYSGRAIGSIQNLNFGSNPIVVPGSSTVSREGIDLKLATAVGDIVWLLETAAAASNVDLGVLKQLLDLLLQLTGSSTNKVRRAEIEAEIAAVAQSSGLSKRADEDITNIILKALAGLKVDLDITSSLKVGDYSTTLSFSQSGVPAATDSSVLKLVGAIGTPLVQYLVGLSTLTFSSAELRDLSDSGFPLKTIGRIANTGPLTASISFDQPVTVSWLKPDNSTLTLGTLPLPAITAVPAGADLNIEGRFAISSVSNFAQFTGYMLKSKSFTWVITSESVTVNALQNTFKNIKLTKEVTLSGFNGLDQLSITAFDLPSDDPLGGIKLNIGATLLNPSSISIELGTLTFENYYQDQLVGPVTSSGSVFLQGTQDATPAPNALSLSGRITPRTGTADTIALASLFGEYLAGHDAILTVKGKNVVPPNGNYVNWLVPVFQQLSLQVKLPGANPVKPLVDAITINDFKLDFTTGAFNPKTTSNNIVAQFKSPFGFPINVFSVAQNLTVFSHSTAIATISVPFNDAKTDPATNLISTGIGPGKTGPEPRFELIPGAEASYIGFLGETLNAPTSTFTLRGLLNSYAATGAGNLPLFGIPLDVSTTIKGFNNFGGSIVSDPTSFNLDIDTLTTTVGVNSLITSDSPVTVIAGPVVFQFEYTAIGLIAEAGKVQTFGQVVIENMVVGPGQNVVPAVSSFSLLPYLEDLTAPIIEFSTLALDSQDVPIVIVGYAESTNIPSLQPIFSHIRLNTVINLHKVLFPDGGRTTSIISRLAEKGLKLPSVDVEKLTQLRNGTVSLASNITVPDASTVNSNNTAGSNGANLVGGNTSAASRTTVSASFALSFVGICSLFLTMMF